MYATQCIDTFIDNTAHQPIPHDTEQDARRYAVELTSRRRCQVVVAKGSSNVATYENGQELPKEESKSARKM